MIKKKSHEDTKLKKTEDEESERTETDILQE